MQRFLCGMVAALCLLSPFYSQAQGILDTWRYSTQTVNGTARGQAIGGATSALGADLSVLTTNPGGIGLYTGSYFSASPAIRLIDTQSEFIGSPGASNNTQFGFAQFGYVKHNPIFEAGERRIAGWKSWTLALGYTQVNHYNRNTAVTGFNPYNSLGDFFAWQANLAGSEASGVRGSIAAFDAFVYDVFANADPTRPDTFESSVTGNIDQELILEERGRMGQWTIAVAGNFSDFFYVGGSVGITDIRNDSRFIFSEFDTQNNYNGDIRNDSLFFVGPFNNWFLDEQLDISGIGINFSIGAVVQATDFLRLGFAFHSPTWASITTTYRTEVFLQDDNGAFYPDFFENSELGEYRYNISTPYRVTGGATVIIAKRGFISADIEYVDYPSARLTPAANFDADFSETNEDIANFSEGGLNLRIGGELKLGDFYLRGGYAYYGAQRTPEGETSQDLATYVFNAGPTVNNFSVDERQISSTRTALTGGLGYRGKGFTVDLAVVAQTQQSQFSVYGLPDDFPETGAGVAPVVFQDDTILRGVLSLGFSLRD